LLSFAARQRCEALSPGWAKSARLLGSAAWLESSGRREHFHERLQGTVEINGKWVDRTALAAIYSPQFARRVVQLAAEADPERTGARCGLRAERVWEADVPGPPVARYRFSRRASRPSRLLATTCGWLSSTLGCGGMGSAPLLNWNRQTSGRSTPRCRPAWSGPLVGLHESVPVVSQLAGRVLALVRHLGQGFAACDALGA
jgi:hypothetical protein